MNDDLQVQLESLAGQVPPGRPDIGEVVTGGRRIKRRRMVMSGVASLLVLGLAGGVWAQVTSRGPEGTPIVSGSEEDCDSVDYDLIVYLRDDITDLEREALLNEIQRHRSVRVATFASKRDAYEEFKDFYRGQPEFWENLPTDALPASWRITFHDNASDDERQRLDDVLAGFPGVDAVRTGDDMERQNAEACPAIGEEDLHLFPRPGPTVHSSERPRFSIRYPDRWYRAESSLTPRLVDPVELVSIGTYPLEYRKSDCAHMPMSALEDIGPVDAFISVQERESGMSDAVKRPDDLRRAFRKPTEGLECMPTGVRVYWMPFRDGDRAFYGLLVLGRTAPKEIEEAAWDVINSFSTTTRPK